MVVAALSSWHEEHDEAAAAVDGIAALPAHALTEAYAVLTRLPAGLAVPAQLAAEVLAERFGDTPLALPAEARRDLLTTLCAAGVVGAASYDGLVALEAHAHGHELLTLDRRAERTYRRLGIGFRML